MEVLKDKLVKAQTGVDLFEQVGKKCIFALVIPRSAKEWPRTCLRRVEKSAARTYAHTLVTSFLHMYYIQKCILWCRVHPLAARYHTTTARNSIYSNKSASYSFGTITYFRRRRRRIIMTIVSTNKITGEAAKSVAFIMNSVQAGLSTQTSIPGPFAVRRRLGAQHSRNPHLY